MNAPLQRICAVVGIAAAAGLVTAPRAIEPSATRAGDHPAVAGPRNERTTASQPRASTDSSAVVAAVAAFHAALARGDSIAAVALLSTDAIIMEAGGIETLAEYRSHHLPADIAFARALPGVHTVRAATNSGDAAWVSSTSVTEGQFNGRAVNSSGAELVVLSRVSSAAPWIIRAVHWSSRRRTP